MAKVKIQGHASGTGILTVTAPNTSTDRTITLPDSTGTLATTADTFDPDGAVTINDTGADVDFRLESDNSEVALTVEGSSGNVGLNTSSPALYAGAGEPIGSPLLTILNTGNTIGGELILGRQTSNTGDRPWGSIAFVYGGGGTSANRVMGRISSYADQSTYGGDSGDLRFYTQPTGGVEQERLKITTDGRGLSQFTAKGWVNADQTDHTIRDSHNVSSISDEATGKTRVNWDNDLGNDHRYCPLATGYRGAFISTYTLDASSWDGLSRNAADVAEDSSYLTVACFSD